MKFFADLHVHSHFARATAKNLDLEHMYKAAQLKGITLVGTGDFTHPGWLAEIEEKLVPAEPGLFKLKRETADPIDEKIPGRCRRRVRFILQCEISSIYKKDDRVRKNHNLVYFPDISIVKNFNAKLDRIGNLKSDGRPILGLDCERLLEIVLDTSDKGFLIPAHIWTPWFSMFGSKSGFDSIEECFGPLSSHIFAAETGLSSDPPMNWRVADLDRVRLVSSSDAHSPMYIGRNASVFNTELSFFSLKDALETGDMEKFQGTIDMYPQEGKYHFDGHRKCGVCFNPRETKKNNGICPQCGRPLTLGVLNRVEQLATRPEGYVPEKRHGFKSIVPLCDILSELCQVGPKTKKVTACYNKALAALGPELDILLEHSAGDISKAKIPLLDRAVDRMRRKKVSISPGFDGEYGKVSLFEQGERESLSGEADLFSAFGKKPVRKKQPGAGRKQSTAQRTSPGMETGVEPGPEMFRSGALPEKKHNKKKQPGRAGNEENPSRDDSGLTLNDEQRRALSVEGVPLIIEAGPGTGKTRTITAKIACMISEKGVAPESILALTFTNRAAGEIKERIEQSVPGKGKKVAAFTFHAFSLSVLKELGQFDSAVAEDAVRKEILKQAFLHAGFSDTQKDLDRIDQKIAGAKQQGLTCKDGLRDAVGHKDQEMVTKVWKAYDHLMTSRKLVDFEDLITMVLNLMKNNADILESMQNRFSFIFVDEYQDINMGQYILIKLLAGKGEGLNVIGDPDQSIYGFRGSDNRYFRQFMTDYPDAVKIILNKNYRSTQTILNASFQMITRSETDSEKEKLFSDINGKNRLVILETASDKAEAAAVGKQIERLLGGLSLFSMDAGKADASSFSERSFSDFAVLYRTRKQAGVFASAFEQAGIPFQTADKENVLVRPGIKELVALARILGKRGAFPDLDILFDHLKTGVGKKTREKLRDWFYSLDGTIEHLLHRLVDNPLPGIRKDIWKNISQACKKIEKLGGELETQSTQHGIELLAGNFGIQEKILKDEESTAVFNQMVSEADDSTKGLSPFLDRIALERDIETLEPGAEKVSLMTIHAAKGLEFPVVFITGCEQGLLPYSRYNSPVADIDEERRLFYVAMTRARDLLYLTYAKKRNIFGSVVNCSRSCFLSDIEEQLKEYTRQKYTLKTPEIKEKQLELF
ncbi:MAG: UvrD-helicase domain-containing protein [Thermodesulfobacteriota bacterium]|nr:UvrD-helicase domain-containing protein [Thermodesulfobacteriota bacterium]